MMRASSVPSFFTCPISLELMKDPVTLSTGQTFERKSIERWFRTGHNTCPTTMQAVSMREVVPNHSLQRLIRQWCASNHFAYPAGDSLPAEGPPARADDAADLKKVQRLLQRVAKGGAGGDVHSSLKRLRNLAKNADDHENRRVLREAGAVPTLAAYVFSPENLDKDPRGCEEALGVLTLLPLHKLRLVMPIGAKQLTAISWMLNRGALEGRVSAARFLAAVVGSDEGMKATVGATAGVFEGLVQLMKEDGHARSLAVGLKAIVAILDGGPERNAERAVMAGVVVTAAELLPEAEKRNAVRSLSRLLALLCLNDVAREAVSSHALIVPVLARFISLEDDVASDNAVACLWSLCRQFPERTVDEAVEQTGMFTQLLRVAQAQGRAANPETKQRATQLLVQLRDKLQSCHRRRP